MTSEQQGDARDQASAAAGEPLGLRLRHAREAKGLSVAEVGERLRLPVAIIEAMEREDFERLGAWVYARGHLTGYARLVGVPVVAIDSALKPEPPPPLTSSVHVPRAHFLIDRYARRAVYVVLTASIVLPVVWLATRDQLPGRSMVVNTLDSQPTAANAALQPRPERLRVDDLRTDPRAAQRPDTVVASITPFYRETQQATEQPAAQPPTASTAPAAPSAERQLRLRFDGPSWVEVLAHDGRRLEFGLIAAGEARSFPAADVARVSIGDADAVDVRVDGEELDLSPYRRAKVARFTLSSSGEMSPSGG